MQEQLKGKTRDWRRCAGQHLKLASRLLATAAAIPWLAASPAFAQETPPPAIPTEVPAGPDASAEDHGEATIVVTARKREETLLETPLSITAISNDVIEDRRVVELLDLPALAPGLSVALQSGFNRLFIRGVGLTSVAFGADSSVAFHVDGVAIGRPSAQLSSFFDLERIEVLRGPQGTLYGRNATGGSVNLISRRPTRSLDGYVNATYGNYGLFAVDAAVGGPLNASGTVLARLAVQSIDRNGYGRNRTLNEDIDDEDRKSLRLSLLFLPTENLEILLSADYSREDDSNYALHAFGPYRPDTRLAGVVQGGSVLIANRDILSDAPTINERTNWGVRASIDLDLSENIALRSIAGYREFERFNVLDVDTTSYAFGIAFTTEEAEQFSEELQLVISSERLNGIVGLFYYNEHIFADQRLPFIHFARVFSFPDALFRQFGEQDINAYAAFAEFSYEIVPNLNLTAGLRYSEETRDSQGSFTLFDFTLRNRNIVTPVPFERSWNSFTPRFGIDYKLNENVLFFASVTRGFKSGVITIGATNPPVDPEYVWSYEAGIHAALLNNRLTANLSVFHYDYSNLQVSRVQGTAVVTVNAAAAAINGAELSINARLTSNLRVNADIAYLDAQFTDFMTANPGRLQAGVLDLSGNRLPQAPEWTVNLGAEYVLPLNIPGELTLRGAMAYRSRAYFTEFNDRFVSAPGHALFDASLDYETANRRWRFGIWGKNLTDELVPANFVSGQSLFGFALNGALKPPRTYGIRAGVSF